MLQTLHSNLHLYEAVTQGGASENAASIMEHEEDQSWYMTAVIIGCFGIVILKYYRVVQHRGLQNGHTVNYAASCAIKAKVSCEFTSAIYPVVLVILHRHPNLGTTSFIREAKGVFKDIESISKHIHLQRIIS